MANFSPTIEGFEAFAAKAGYSGTGKTRTKVYGHGTLYLRHYAEGVEFRRVNRRGEVEAKLFLQV